MTHRTSGSHDQATPAIADTSPASIRSGLAALLAQSDIVRPELRNASILGAQATPRLARRDNRNHHTPPADW